MIQILSNFLGSDQMGTGEIEMGTGVISISPVPISISFSPVPNFNVLPES